MRNKKFFSIASMIFILVINKFALAADSLEYQDPYESLNKKIFKFNNDLDVAIFKPVAQGYAYLVPRRVRTSVGNFFQNIAEPSVVANDILQGDYLNSMADTWRFLINSTLGLGGLFDVASQMKEPIIYRPNDFGLTLMFWGLNKPNYFVIPFFGPSTDVDFLGRLVNYYAFTPYPYIKPYHSSTALLGLYYLNERAQLSQYDNLLTTVALDPYVFQRNAYLQLRQSQLAQIKQQIRGEYA